MYLTLISNNSTGELQDIGAAPHERGEHPHEGQGHADAIAPDHQEQAHQVHRVPPEKIVAGVRGLPRQQQC